MSESTIPPSRALRVVSMSNADELGEPQLLDVTAELRDGRSIEYSTRIPDIEAAVVLKAHAWKSRRMQ
ncbi:MAG: hypothetical protein L0G94_09400 [Brachybacterium sp.]|uniref:hypothetical protein n=1 Tax=Brachybacterium sp. TaxID=1891286 RepID=UPI0026473421|nr:hypothetical protein [Brachybacterium sp.]MDN5686879.1 hypothetical protein [Brachybacterium sp.]